MFKVKSNKNKKFGIIILLLVTFLFFYLNVSLLFLIISIISILLVIIFFDNLLSPFTFLWLRFGSLLNKLISPVIVTLIFFLILTPLGLLLRFFKRDELMIRYKNKKSTWKNRYDIFTNFDKQF